MKRDHRDFVDDMQQAISDIESFTEGMERSSFQRDKKTVHGRAKASIRGRMMAHGSG